MRANQKIYQFLHRFMRAEEGGILILFGIGVVMLIAIGGASIDLGIQQLMRAKMQNASDAAATSAASLKAPGITVDTAMRTAAADRYFKLNYPATFYGEDRPTPVFNVTDSSVEVTAGGTIATTFVKQTGTTHLDSAANSKVSFSTDMAAQTSDIVLVLDTSGSMLQPDAGGGLTRIQALKNTSTAFIADVLSNNPNNRVGVILWNSAVVGTLPLTNDSQAAQDFVNAHQIPTTGPGASPGTYSVLGMAAVGTSMAFRPDVVKAVILMTDGSNNMPNPWNSQTLTHCTNYKNQGMQVYTIAFGNDVQQPCRQNIPASYIPSGNTGTLSLCMADTPLDVLNGPACRYTSIYTMVNGVAALQTATIVNGVTYTFPANIPAPNTISSNDSNYCVRPFLEQCASNSNNFYATASATGLAAAFTSISSNIASIRIIQ